MNAYIDVKYINLCSSSLEKFKQKNNNLCQFRCPICGDSKKNKNKARGFIYEKQNKYFYRCHNCEVGTSFGRFLEKVNPNMHREYVTEQYREREDKSVQFKQKTEEKFEPEHNGILEGLDKISSLDKDHPARKYLTDRLIPERNFSKLYFCTEFRKWTNRVIPNKFSTLKGDTPRLVIPFFDSRNNIIGFQGRSFDPKDLCKYITIKLKGVEDLIKSFNNTLLTDFKLKIIGEGPELKYLKSKYLDDKIEFIGRLDNKDVLKIIQESKALSGEKSKAIHNKQTRDAPYIKFCRAPRK